MLAARGYRRVRGELVRRHGLDLRWLGQSELRRRSTNAFLAVARGAAARGRPRQRRAGLAHPFRRGPLDADLKSKVADVLQCAVETKGDHILAARFLSDFVPPEIPWAHLDLSAATRADGLGHITGFGVRFTLELLVRENLLQAVREQT